MINALDKYKPIILDVTSISFGESKVLELKYKMLSDDYPKIAYQVVSVGHTSKDTIPKEIHNKSIGILNDFKL